MSKQKKGSNEVQPSPQASHSPVTYDKNGLPLSTKYGSLTGILRRVKDMSAELYNAIQTWNSQHTSGMDVLYEIIERSSNPEAETDNGITSLLRPQLEESFKKLEEICDIMTEIVQKVGSICDNFQGLKKLEELRENVSSPVFQTWTIDHFVSLSKKVYESYQKELNVKLSVKENIGRCRRDVELMLYSALWCHEPYVDESINIYLDMMLRESCHR